VKRTIASDVDTGNMLKRRVEVHLPVEVCISSGVSDNLLVEVLNMVGTCLVLLNGYVDIIDERHEVVLVLSGNILVPGVGLVEPCDDLILVEVEGEGVVLDVDPGF